MAPFAGYDMPIAYPTGALEEHLITRRSVGLFDIDHMGQLEISGPSADDFVSRMTTARTLDMKRGDARYSLLLDESGHVTDDLFIYRLPGRWWIVVNASNRETDYCWFQKSAPSGVKVVDRSDDTYMIAIQGPRAVELLDLVSDIEVSRMTRFTSSDASVAGVPCLVGRTGYTGEDGVELFFPSGEAVNLWNQLLNVAANKGVEASPIGLAARDSLRFEAGMPLHGHEISPSINPVEAGFKWACDLEKDFVGKAAVLAMIESGPSRRLVGLDVSGGVPREGYEVQTPAGKSVGVCVAGMFCPSVKKYAANAFVDPAFLKTGTELKVVIHGKPKDAVVVKRPLYVPTYRR